jgi:hypothetical protein
LAGAQARAALTSSAAASASAAAASAAAAAQQKRFDDGASLLIGVCAEPTLRASLLLALYRHHSPRVRTSCCQSLHCFNCKTVGFHDGRTCAQVAEARAVDDILPCPKCGTSIVKGDGCGSIACICGHGFSWSLELKKLRARQATMWEERFAADATATPATIAATAAVAAAASRGNGRQDLLTAIRRGVCLIGSVPGAPPELPPQEPPELQEPLELRAAAVLAMDEWLSCAGGAVSGTATSCCHQGGGAAAATELCCCRSSTSKGASTAADGRGAVLVGAAYALALPPLGVPASSGGTSVADPSPAAMAEARAEPDALLTHARAWAAKHAKRMVGARAELWRRYCAHHPEQQQQQQQQQQQPPPQKQCPQLGGGAAAASSAEGDLPEAIEFLMHCAQTARSIFERCDAGEVNRILEASSAKGRNASMLAQLRERVQPHVAAASMATPPLSLAAEGISKPQHSAEDTVLLSLAKTWASENQGAVARVCYDRLGMYAWLRTRPAELRPDTLEMHLPDDEFAVVFGMSRGEFGALPKWRQREAKRRVNLF